jgi:hypothetical protein
MLQMHYSHTSTIITTIRSITLAKSLVLDLIRSNTILSIIDSTFNSNSSTIKPSVRGKNPKRYCLPANRRELTSHKLHQEKALAQGQVQPLKRKKIMGYPTQIRSLSESTTKNLFNFGELRSTRRSHLQRTFSIFRTRTHLLNQTKGSTVLYPLSSSSSIRNKLISTSKDSLSHFRGLGCLKFRPGCNQI